MCAADFCLHVLHAYYMLLFAAVILALCEHTADWNLQSVNAPNISCILRAAHSSTAYGCPQGFA